jgi:hypothetical protein
MKLKKLLTAVLLLFIVGSLFAMALKRLQTAGGDGAAAQAGADSANLRPDRLIVYSFHRNNRCENCQAIEAYAHEAVQSGFKEQLSDGRVEWKVVNFDEPANKHFDADFELGEVPSVVLVQCENNAPKRWKNLTEVWKLVVGDNKAEFVEYVQKELREFTRS